MQNIMGLIYTKYFVYSLRHFKYNGCVGVEPGVGGGAGMICGSRAPPLIEYIYAYNNAVVAIYYGAKTLNFFYYAFCLTDAPNQ